MTDARLFQVDAFTSRPYAGNPAGVVIGGPGLSARQMQAIAREINNSETAFLLPPDSDDHDLRIRFFTPTQEVPSCGHATVAAHYVRARLLNAVPGTVRHKIKAGLLSADVDIRNGDYFITVTQAPPRISPPIRGSQRAAILAALRLSEADIPPGLPFLHIDTGNPKIMVPLKSRSLLDGMAPNMDALCAFHRTTPNGGYFIFSLEDPDPGITAHSRMFAPNIGIPEDPVTGNGNGPLGVYMVATGQAGIESGRYHLRGRQGEAFGRPGEVDVWVDVNEREAVRVRIGGRAVTVFEAALQQFPG